MGLEVLTDSGATHDLRADFEIRRSGCVFYSGKRFREKQKPSLETKNQGSLNFIEIYIKNDEGGIKR